ncbi:hypothetical protein, partial [Natrinema gari]|uniref:hypothetical protein n=1 Tax=Natrinema gari TaxID=419186 RepID=UPI0019D37C08
PVLAGRVLIITHIPCEGTFTGNLNLCWDSTFSLYGSIDRLFSNRKNPVIAPIGAGSGVVQDDV